MTATGDDISAEQLAALTLIGQIGTETLGRRLRALRRARGPTQSEVMGVDGSSAYLSRIESGQRRPSTKLLLAMLERMGCTTLDLTREPTLAPQVSINAYTASAAADAAVEWLNNPDSAPAYHRLVQAARAWESSRP